MIENYLFIDKRKYINLFNFTLKLFGMKQLWWVVSLLFIITSHAQHNKHIDSLYQPDPFYLEDQVYFGISYIALRNLPEPFTQNGFSNSVKFGYIRDIPINKRRNMALGLGLGMAWDTYYQNLRISIDETNGNLQFQVLTNTDDFRNNSFTLKKIEIPFEIRIRGSNATRYKFWRLYTGITFSYIYGTQSEYVTNLVDVIFKDIKIIRPWQSGLNFSAGYGAWNFNFYYGISNIINDNVVVQNKKFKMKDTRFGIVFYFL